MTMCAARLNQGIVAINNVHVRQSIKFIQFASFLNVIMQVSVVLEKYENFIRLLIKRSDVAYFLYVAL